MDWETPQLVFSPVSKPSNLIPQTTYYLEKNCALKQTKYRDLPNIQTKNAQVITHKTPFSPAKECSMPCFFSHPLHPIQSSVLTKAS